MGQSTNAILYYGFEFYSEDDYKGYTEEDFERFETLIEDFYDIDEHPVCIGMHCSYSSPMYYIYAYALTACRGGPAEVDLNIFTLEKERVMQDEIKQFCITHKIAYEEPKWMLVSFWEV